MHPLSGSLPLPCVPVRVARGALASHICTRLLFLATELLSAVEPLCPLTVSLERSW